MLTVTPRPSPNPQESGELDNASGMDKAMPGPVIESTTQEPSPDQLPSTSAPVGEVRLLNATRIPAGYQKMVRAKVEGHTCIQMSLFTPLRRENGIMMADGVVDLKDEHCMVLVVQNYGTTPVKLKKGCILGDVVPVVEYSPSGSSTAPPNEAVVCDLTVETDPAARNNALLQKLDMKIDHLTPEEQKPLTDLILTYSNVFALDATELGTTDVVSHTINTGDHTPLKQPLRRTPFALREKVDELVREMLSQGVIQQSKSPWASGASEQKGRRVAFLYRLPST